MADKLQDEKDKETNPLYHSGNKAIILQKPKIQINNKEKPMIIIEHVKEENNNNNNNNNNNMDININNNNIKKENINQENSTTIVKKELERTRSSTRSGSSLQSSVTYTKLQNLKSLYDEGFITETEFSERKSQLIDQLTGTSMMKKKQDPTVDDRKPMRTVIARPPPNWEDLQAERAVKIAFNIPNRSWSEEATMIKVDGTPFANGALRMAYHMQDLKVPDDTFVLKVSNDPNEDSEVYYRDVEMQLFAYQIAEKFNVYKPPKPVAFVKAWLVKLPRRGNQLCAVERFISGPYRKHNNNYGFVNEDERNTPQAFSHFSYEVSGHTLLICDIQGVADMYTDPQIHTMAGDDKNERPFGKGNLGQRGIDQFLKTHRCNPICRYLKLPPINPRIDDLGTVPVDTVMPEQNIDIIRIHVTEGPGGRLAINALSPQTVAAAVQQQQQQQQPPPGLNPLFDPKNSSSPPLTKSPNSIESNYNTTTTASTSKKKITNEQSPLLQTNKKTKITITAEESSSCICC